MSSRPLRGLRRRRSPAAFPRVLAGLLAVLTGCDGGSRPPSPPADPGPASGPGGPVAAPPPAPAPAAPLPSDAEREVLAMPIFAARYFDEAKTRPAHRVNGSPRVLSRSPRPGGELVRLAVDVERRTRPDQAPFVDTILVDVRLDPSGRLVQAETRGVRDADTREWETLLAQ